MSQITYVNGKYLPHGKACLHVEDRSTQFSDGVYEVIAVISGNLVDPQMHYRRLIRSLTELEMNLPMSVNVLHLNIKEVIRRNQLNSGLCYLQISRGSAPRNHVIPNLIKETVVITARHSEPNGGKGAKQGVSIITTEDIRWKRPDIKSVSLLPNVLAKNQAAQRGAFEAWLVESGEEEIIIEGSSSNTWIVSQSGQVITHPEGVKMLSGVTRNRIIDLAKSNGIEVLEKPFTVTQAKTASEAFMSSTSSFVVPVIDIDGHKIGNGKCGPVTTAIQKLYNDFAQRSCGEV